MQDIKAGIPQGYSIFNHYNSRSVHSRMKAYEMSVLQEQKLILSSGSGIAHYFQYHEKQDICFISEKRNKSRNNLPVVSLNDLPREVNDLEHDLLNLAFSFVKIKGHYETREDSFAVFNTVEDSNMFFNAMKKLGGKFKQKSILMVPKKGTGLPFIYYFKDGSVKEADKDTPEIFDGMVETYFSQLKSRKFKDPFTWSQVKLDISDLMPRRSGMACMVTVGMRESIQGFKYTIDNAVREIDQEIANNLPTAPGNE